MNRTIRGKRASNKNKCMIRNLLLHFQAIDGFQSRDETAMLVHKTIANYGSCIAL